MAIVWEEKYSVGVEIIDSQHRQFVSILGRLSKAVEEMKTKEVLDQIVTDLENYSEYHFKTEEGYFERFNFDGAKEHIQEHKDFINKLSEIKKSNLSGSLEMSMELVSFMIDWIVTHISSMDRKYIECFHKNGLK